MKENNGERMSLVELLRYRKELIDKGFKKESYYKNATRDFYRRLHDIDSAHNIEMTEVIVCLEELYRDKEYVVCMAYTRDMLFGLHEKRKVLMSGGRKKKTKTSVLEVSPKLINTNKMRALKSLLIELKYSFRVSPNSIHNSRVYEDYRKKVKDAISSEIDEAIVYLENHESDMFAGKDKADMIMYLRESKQEWLRPDTKDVVSGVSARLFG